MNCRRMVLGQMVGIETCLVKLFDLDQAVFVYLPKSDAGYRFYVIKNAELQTQLMPPEYDGWSQRISH